jgi:hypothetical protein
MTEARDSCQFTIPQCPRCKETVQHPVGLKCLHSYCKKCLDDIPKTKVNDLDGWMCQSCDTFTSEKEATPDKLLETLVAMESGQDMNETKLCDFCDEVNAHLAYSPHCRMTICNKCQHKHEKPPHSIQTIKEDCATSDIIDKTSYCDQHQIQEVIYCSNHDKYVCSVCQVDHRECQTQTTKALLNKVVVEMDDYKNLLNWQSLIFRSKK